MSPRRNGEGPTRMKDGATMKVTFTGKDRCYLGICTRVPNHIIAFFDRRVWVCKDCSRYDGIR
jgi:hypothetical protein